MGKDWKSCESGEISHSEPLWWEKIGKVANQAKLAIPSHSEPLWWGKIGKVVNQEKLAILSHSKLLWWEKIGKVATQTKSNFSREGGGVHQPEAQCHVDPKFQLNLKNMFSFQCIPQTRKP